MKRLACLSALLALVYSSFAQFPGKGKYGVGPDDVPVAGVIKGLSDDQLQELVQKQTFRLFSHAAHPVERGWIGRHTAVRRLIKIADFLINADCYHGIYPHFMNGRTGKTIKFDRLDDAADIVEPSYLLMGFLCTREYFNKDLPREVYLRKRINQMWGAANWNWHTNLEKKLRLAIIGCGSVCHRYIPHLQTSSLPEIVSFCDIKYDRAVAQNKQYNVNAATYPNIDKMLAGVSFDMMITLTDMQQHGDLNKKALMGGKHVWSEKPMANTYAERKALIDLAGSRKLRIWERPLSSTAFNSLL